MPQQQEINFPALLVRVDGKYRLATSDEIIEAARRELDSRLRRESDVLTSPDLTKEFLRATLATKPYEVFAVLWLDNRHRVIAYENLFRGTIDGASVHPREVVRAAMHFNAAACIFAHNHPSGVTEPSRADLNITKRLQTTLDYIDVRVLDHIIVGETVTSFAEQGLL